MNLTIRTNNLVKSYGSRTVVNGVSFTVQQGEIVGLLGPNGAGKTTSFYQVVGLVKPDDGEVFLNDLNITKLPMYKRAQMGIGYLPQEASVFRKLSVEDNIAAILEMTKLSKQEQKDKLESLLDEFHLQLVRKNNGDTLSGGERRRTEIARALAVNPKFVLLDEPFAGVDPIAVEDIQEIIAKLKFKNIGILITDHNVNETLSICDRAYLLIDGKIFRDGTAEELAVDEQVKRLYLGRNFELKRKDYLHEEAKGASNTNINSEIKKAENPSSLLSFTQYISDKTYSTIEYLNNRTSGGQKNMDSETEFSDYFKSYNELINSLKMFNKNKRSDILKINIDTLPDLNFKNYRLIFKADDSRIFGGFLWSILLYFKLRSLRKKLEIAIPILGKILLELKISS